jgi:hypothetical protein
MDAAEIVVREMQCDRRFQVRQFLAESFREPREPHKQRICIPHRENRGRQGLIFCPAADHLVPSFSDLARMALLDR